MKKLILAVILVFFCLSNYSQEPDPGIESLINQVNQDSLVSFVRALSGEDSVFINGKREIIAQRVYNTNGLAADYLVEKLTSFGLTPERIEYDQNGTNIVAIQEGWKTPDEFYMICAHYDGVTYYCADDNASGSATVLETARILSTIEFPYSIIYALWDEEEIGLVGSKDYAKNAYEDEMDILGVINIDMIGWDSDDDGLVELHTRDIGTSEDIIDAMLAVNEDYEIMLNPIVQNPGTGASDHSSFWNNGYGAILLIEGYYSDDFNPYYHSSEDRIAKFNIPYFHKAAQLAIGTTAELASGEQTVSITDSKQLDVSLMNYPNPFNRSTRIRFSIDESSPVQLSILNIYGQHIKTVVENIFEKGEHNIKMNSDNLPSGIYTLLLQSENKMVTRQIAVLK